MNHSKTPWAIQKLAEGFHEYPDWIVYAIRDASNHCVAVVGQIDRATCPHNASNANLMNAAPALLDALKLARTTIERLERHAPGSAYGTLEQICKAIALTEGKPI